MTNMEWLASLTAREFYDRLEQIKHDKGRGAPNTRVWMIEWLDKEHTESEATMDRRTEVMSWLEDLTHDDWDAWNSVSEVQNTAKAALELLKEQKPMKPEIDYMMRKRCPKCRTLLRGRYCYGCGQAVKWE